MAAIDEPRIARGVEGALLGTAVGDAMGLPYEGLSRRRAGRLFGPPDRHRFLFGHGMVSDDTEHSCMVLQAWMASGGDEEAFACQFASRLRRWLLGLPAGIGLGTLKATLKLCLGISPQHSGVFSAGNGPAMRGAVLGAAIEDPDRLRRFVRASTRVTHTDPKAENGALAVALAAQAASRGTLDDGPRYLNNLRRLLPQHDDKAAELLTLLEGALSSVARGESTQAFADSLGQTRGVSGYVYHTVPVAIHACLRHPTDFRNAVMEVVACGGDTDTTGAIVGGIVGAAVGAKGIPRKWLAGLCEWPRSVAWMRRLARECSQACDGDYAARPPEVPFVGALLRNLAFLGVVFVHVFRRALPPY